MLPSADFSLLVYASEETCLRIKPLLAGFSSVQYVGVMDDVLPGNFTCTWVPDEALASEAASAWHTGMGHLLLASTTHSLADLGLSQANATRYCGWPGFEDHTAWEVALGSGADVEVLNAFFAVIGREKIAVADIPGFIAPRTIALLVNEAWHVWQNGVALPEDIDRAMQLGTNYPKAPLAWAEQIGLSAIADMLYRIFQPDRLAAIHPSLLKHLSA